MIPLDTGTCAPESAATLLLQRDQLISGSRSVQMFPTGTPELPLPAGMARVANARGVFHFNPAQISAQQIVELSAQGRENEYLNLGPYCKPEIVLRVLRGEKPECITEYTPDGVEVRSAGGTDQTINEQLRYFNATKHSPDSKIVIGRFPDRVNKVIQ
jgi:hypothetical protein